MPVSPKLRAQKDATLADIAVPPLERIEFPATDSSGATVVVYRSSEMPECDSSSLREGLTRLLGGDASRWGRGRSRHLLADIFPDAAGAVQTSAAGSIVFKQETFPFPGWLKTLGRTSSGVREIRNLLRAKALGAPTFTPLFAGEIRRGPFVFRTFMATRELPGGCNLSDWLRDISWKLKRDFPPDAVSAALPDLARLVAGLHRQRFYGGTLRAKNVYMRRSERGELEFFFHDLPRASFRPGTALSVSSAAYDLACLDSWACLWLRPTTRYRLFLSYQQALENGPSARTWLRHIDVRRRRLLKETIFSSTTHWIRRHGKLLPGIGRRIR